MQQLTRKPAPAPALGENWLGLLLAPCCSGFYGFADVSDRLLNGTHDLLAFCCDHADRVVAESGPSLLHAAYELLPLSAAL